MKNTRKYSPATAVGMAIATVAAVAFAIWNVSRSLAPPPPPEKPATVTTAPQSSTQTPTTAAENPNPGTPGPAPERQASAANEALLAPQADPFIQINFPPVQQPQQVAARQPAAVPERILPNFGAPGTAPANPLLSPRAIEAPRVEEAPAPELIGTLLGDKPSAVFRDKDGVVVVAAGKTLGPWKVVRVVHGGAIVVAGKRRLTLGTTLAGAARAERAEEPVETAVPAPKASPAPQPKQEVAENAPDPFLIAEAVPASVPAKKAPEAGNTNPAPAPTPEAPPQPAQPEHETAPPPKQEGVKEEPALPEDPFKPVDDPFKPGTSQLRR